MVDLVKEKSLADQLTAKVEQRNTEPIAKECGSQVFKNETASLRVSKYLRSIEFDKENYLYHTCLGNPVQVNEDYEDYLDIIREGITLQQMDKFPDLKEQTKTLIELGLIEYSGSKDFLEEGVERNIAKAVTGELVKLLVIDVSTRCNLACSYCNVHKTQEKHNITQTTMSFETARTAVDEFIVLCKKTNRRSAVINYFGGEPLLNYKMLESLMRYVASIKSSIKGLEISHGISTNAVLLTDDRIETIKSLDVVVSVSLDGLETENDANRKFTNGLGSYAYVEKSLRGLVKANVPTQVVTTVSKQNADSLKEFIDYMCEIGIKELSIKSTIYRDVPADERRRISVAIKEGIAYARSKGVSALNGPGELNYTRGCQGLGEMLCVEPNGEVFACPEGIRTKLGDADALSDIPNSKEYQHIASRITGNIEACRGCDVEGLCRGGCAGESDYNFDDIFQVNRSACESIRENIKRGLVEMARA